MPTYEYQCDCGMRFEARASIQSKDHDKPCPECSNSAKRLVPSSVSGHFSVEVKGSAPQNTGIHGLDTNYDRVIGQSAAQGWREQGKRYAEKVDLVRKGHDPNKLSLNLDGHYEKLGDQEAGVLKRAHRIHEKASEWRKAVQAKRNAEKPTR